MCGKVKKIFRLANKCYSEKLLVRPVQATFNLLSKKYEVYI